MLPLFRITLLTAVSLLLATASSAFANTPTSTAAGGDLSALLAFKARLSDPHGVLLGNWTADTPYCRWVGVSCGRRHRSRVTAVALPGLPLTGTLAPELGNLSFLSLLDLSNTSLTGPIPGDLGNLPRLLYLNLSSNYLSGPVPPRLGNLTVLQALDLYANNLTGEIPHDLLRGNIHHSIMYLSLARNDLSGTVPDGLFNETSSQLVYLSLAHNSFTGAVPGSIASLSLPNLQALVLSSNQFSGPIPPSLFNLSSLQWLYLDHNNLSGPLPSNNQSFNLPMVQHVNLYKNKLESVVPSGFRACKYMQELVLAYNQFTGGIPSWLSALPELTVISMGGNDLYGEIPAGFGNLTGLTTLDLTTSNLQGKISPELGRLTQLQWLNLENNNLTGTIPTSLRNMSMISMLDISFNSLSGMVPRMIFADTLTELYIDENELSGEVSFMDDLSSCKSLKYIVVNTNYFTGTIPNSISNLSSLQILRAFENQITGPIPNMPSNIWFIDLRNNQLTGRIPVAITELMSVQSIDLSTNALSGTIPAHIGNLSNLYGLSLANNNLHGPIPGSIGNLSRLQVLELSNNSLTSTIPNSLWALQNIVNLDLSFNALSGSLPEDIADLKAISLIDLSSNQINGKLPSSLGMLSTLTSLNLSKNMLQNQVPDALGKLSSLKSLDLSHNFLSGTIPKSFANFTTITGLNLSFNRLYGEIPASGVFSNITLQSLEGNTALCGLPRLEFPQCPTNDEPNTHKQFGFLKVVLPSVIVSVIVGAFLFVLFKTHAKKRSNEQPTLSSFPENNYRPISYFELVRATNNFNGDNLIGSGSFGKVFKGQLDDGQHVAIKILNMDIERATMSFDVECRVLRMARHRNLVRILTTCSSLDFKALVLQYMPNGSLDEWLSSGDHQHGAMRLGLVPRVNIMLDVARAMTYLHHEHFEVVLHCDLKPSNVLIAEDMTGCVADFGIARMLLGDDTSVVSRNMQGTIGYMAPEYASTGKASRKSDVFSYGIMLLEVITGKKPTDTMFSEDLSLREWVSQALPSRFDAVVDPSIFMYEDGEATSSRDTLDYRWRSREQSPNGWRCLEQILDLGLQCSRGLPEERMMMKDVAAKLQRIKEELSPFR